jgi:hypothetical protein
MIMQDDELSDAAFAEIEVYLSEILLSGRGYLSSSFFGAGFLALGVGPLQTFAICVLVYFLYVSRFGSRRIEQVGLLMLAISILTWTDIVPTKSLIANAKLLAISSASAK